MYIYIPVYIYSNIYIHIVCMYIFIIYYIYNVYIYTHATNKTIQLCFGIEHFL